MYCDYKDLITKFWCGTNPFSQMLKQFFFLLILPRRKEYYSICVCLTFSNLCWAKKLGIYIRHAYRIILFSPCYRDSWKSDSFRKEALKKEAKRIKRDNYTRSNRVNKWLDGTIIISYFGGSNNIFADCKNKKMFANYYCDVWYVIGVLCKYSPQLALFSTTDTNKHKFKCS